MPYEPTDAFDSYVWEAHELTSSWSLRVLPFVAFFVGWIAADDWIGGLAGLSLWLAWRLLLIDGAPPVLFWAFAFEWMQATIGLFYSGLTGRILPTMVLSDYRPMVLLGLGCVMALAIGLRSGVALHRWVHGQRRRTADPPPTHVLLSWRFLITTYVAMLGLNGTLLTIAGQYPELTQPLFALTAIRLGLLLLIFRRLVRPQFRTAWFVAILGLEVALGASGFFASFREPLMLAAIAMFEQFDRRRASHWVAVAGIAAASLTAGVVWIGVQKNYRADYAALGSRVARLERLGQLTALWWDQNQGDPGATIDALVGRLWAVYYPALAIARVPEVLPHTNGALLEAAVMAALEPRIFFPNKPPLPSDSDLVRKYSGVYVAGPESNTSIAFGYAAESYIDFGVPWMFAPSLVFGLLMGIAFSWFLTVIRHIELSTALVTVVYWLSLYLFERSWAFMIGQAGTMILYLGGVTLFVDRYLFARLVARGDLVEVPPEGTGAFHSQGPLY